MSNKIEDLVLEMQPKAKKAIALMQANKKLKDLGVTDFYINETKRSLAVQMAYYSRGRMAKTSDVKAMYAAAGLYTPTETECKTPNTWTLNSNHIAGRAIDIVPMTAGDKIWWNAPVEVWQLMGECGEAAGLKWGGRWTEKDYPHYEI